MLILKLLFQDGTFYENNEIHIEVLDVNDSPPRFIQAGPSVIDEEEAVVSYLWPTNTISCSVEAFERKILC